MGLAFTKFGKYNSEKMENRDAKKHSNMLCFNNTRSDSLVPSNNNVVQKKRFSLNRFRRRCKRSDDNSDFEDLREEFDRINRIRYDLESNKPIKMDDSIGNCDGLVCLHNGSTVLRSRSNSVGEDEGKSKSVDYLHEREKSDDSLSFLSVKSEIITTHGDTSRSSSCALVEAEEKCPAQLESSEILNSVVENTIPSPIEKSSRDSQLDDKTVCIEGSNTEEQGVKFSTVEIDSSSLEIDIDNQMDPTPPNSPDETIFNITYGTVLGEQNIVALKSKIQKEIDRQTGRIAEEDEEEYENS